MQKSFQREREPLNAEECSSLLLSGANMDRDSPGRECDGVVWWCGGSSGIARRLLSQGTLCSPDDIFCCRHKLLWCCCCCSFRSARGMGWEDNEDDTGWASDGGETKEEATSCAKSLNSFSTSSALGTCKKRGEAEGPSFDIVHLCRVLCRMSIERGGSSYCMLL